MHLEEIICIHKYVFYKYICKKGTITRTDQGHRHTLLEVPGLTCPGRGSNPGLRVGSEHSRKEPSRHLICWLFGTPTHDEAGTTTTTSTWLPQCRCIAHGLLSVEGMPEGDSKSASLNRTYCYPNSTDGHEINHVGVTTIARPDQGHSYTLLEVPGLTCPSRGSNPGLSRGKRALQKRAI